MDQRWKMDSNSETGSSTAEADNPGGIARRVISFAIRDGFLGFCVVDATLEPLVHVVLGPFRRNFMPCTHVATPSPAHVPSAGLILTGMEMDSSKMSGCVVFVSTCLIIAACCMRVRKF